MSRLRWRLGAFCAVLCAVALTFSLKGVNAFSAEGQQGETAWTGDDRNGANDGADEGKSPKTRKKEVKKKPQAEKKKAAKPPRSRTRAGQTPKSNGSVPGIGIGGIPGNDGSNRDGAKNDGPGTQPGQGGQPGGEPASQGGAAGGKAGALQQQAGGKYPPEVQRVVDVQNKYSLDLMKQTGIVGTATGLTRDGKVVVQVFTNGNGNPQVPGKLDGVETEVIMSGAFRPMDGTSGSAAYNPKARATRPVPIGVSAAPEVPSCSQDQNCFSGTLGCRLKSKQGDSVYALSNNHVFANQNANAIGARIMQPSPGEALINCACLDADVIGRLYRLTPIDVSFFGINVMDAAVIKTTKEQVSNRTLPDGYGTPRTFTIRDAQLGMRVEKYGRTTGYTKGVVLAVNFIAVVPYETAGGIAFFEKQILITGDEGVVFAAGGDSGSLIVTRERFPLALLFAGSDLLNLTIGSPIQPILDEFQMEIDGDSSTDFTPPGKIGSAGGQVPENPNNGPLGDITDIVPLPNDKSGSGGKSGSSGK